jgi:hypothetical protein
MYFEILGTLVDIEVIAEGSSVRERRQPREHYGAGRWRKLEGVGTVRVAGGGERRAEIHWYEAHGIGRVRYKIKRFLD